MKILVCFKIIPDLDQLSSSDFIVRNATQIDTSFVKTMINCFDESGLEFGLRLSENAESLNIVIEKSALTVGNNQAEVYLKTLNALQYDNTVWVKNNDDVRFKPEIVSDAISNFIKENPQDIIIMGRQSPEGSNFSTPQFVAEQLKIPLVTNVIDITLLGKNQICVKIEVDGDIYEQVIQTPIVVTIGNAIISKLRVPTLKDRLKSNKKEICQLSLPLFDNKLFGEIVSMKFVDRKREGLVIEEEADKAIEILFEKYLRERINNL